MSNDFGKDEFLKGSLVLILSLGIFNVLNYVFQMSMARLLGPAEYGILAVLMSLVYIFSIPSEGIQTITSSYASRFNVKKENGKIRDLMIRGLKKGLVFSVGIFFIFGLISFWLSNLLRISNSLLLITGLVLFGSFTMPITRGILQGTKRFSALGMNMILEAALKVILAISLVIVGLGAIGGIFGLILALFGAFILSFLPLKFIINSKRERNDFGQVYSYNLPGLVAITSIVLIYSLDIIFARIFFNPVLAGQYAFMSLVGKVIFFANMAVGKAMFPLTFEKSAMGIGTGEIFKKAFMLTSAVCLVALVFYFFFPVQVIKTISLGSSQYTEVSGILILLGIAFSFVSFSNLLVLYNLSTNRMQKTYFPLLVFVIMEVLLFQFFHSNLIEFSLVVVFSSFIMLLYLLILSLIKRKSKKQRAEHLFPQKSTDFRGSEN